MSIIETAATAARKKKLAPNFGSFQLSRNEDAAQKSDFGHKEPNPNMWPALCSPLCRAAALTQLELCAASARREELKKLPATTSCESDAAYQPAAERGRRAKVNGPQEVSGVRTPRPPLLTLLYRAVMGRGSKTEIRVGVFVSSLATVWLRPRDKRDSDASFIGCGFIPF